MEWQPIETAPKPTEGGLVHIDVWLDNGDFSRRVPDAYWLHLAPGPCWYASNEGYPGEPGPLEVDGARVTHWMLPPEPPAQGTSGSA